MKDPFQKIANSFREKTACEVNVNYANAARIQTQINASQEGDIFIAGAAEELKPVQKAVSSSKNLVKHIPVLAVQKGNPLGISDLKDLTRPKVRVVLADAASTPIGKISDKVLGDLGILDKINIVSRTLTAPAIATALKAGECDAVILWKENCNPDFISVVNTKDLDSQVKLIPAASLTYSKSETARKEFLNFLDSNEVKNIWKQAGYEIIN